jgi:hypothetical protein
LRMRHGAFRFSFNGLIAFTFLSTALSCIPSSGLESSTASIDENYVVPRSPNTRPLIETPTDATQPPYSVESSFLRWLKHYKNPVVCDMIFCHGSCANYDDSCPSFRHHLLSFLDEASCNSNVGPNSESSDSGESCHVDNSRKSETFSDTGSPFK